MNRLELLILLADNCKYKYQEDKILKREEEKCQVPTIRSHRVRVFEICIEATEHQGEFYVGEGLHNIEEDYLEQVIGYK